MAWGKEVVDVSQTLGISEKSVPGIDEDAVTIALEAARRCFAPYGKHPWKPTDIEALFVGSESHPYAVNPTSTIVGELLGIGHHYVASDLEFACKAGTTAIQAVAGLLASDQISCGLAIGADTAQSKPHDALEYTSAAAGAAILLGRDTGDRGGILAELVAFTSYSSDTPDFWRRDGIRYPSHAGRFTGEPAYFAHVMGAANRLFETVKCGPKDFDYCVFHMPNGKFPRDAAGRLGFTDSQLATSLLVDVVGNPYTASSMLGLAAILDEAKPGASIFMVSYGSGAGSDAFAWKVTGEITTIQAAKRTMSSTVKDQIRNKRYINYVRYLKQTHKI